MLGLYKFLVHSFGSGYGNRTRLSGLKGRRLSRLTNPPYYFYNHASSKVINEREFTHGYLAVAALALVCAIISRRKPVAGKVGLEPTTYGLTDRRYYRLSYIPILIPTPDFFISSFTFTICATTQMDYNTTIIYSWSIII